LRRCRVAGITEFAEALPTAPRAPASAAPAAKSAETSATPAPAARTASPPAGAAAESSADYAAEEGANPPATPSTRTTATGCAPGESSENTKADEDEKEDQPKGDAMGRLVGFRRKTIRRRSAYESDAAIGSDVAGELAHGGFDAGAEIVDAEKWNHGAACVASASVGDDRLEAVADFCPVLMFGRRDQEKDAAVIFFSADAELFEEFVPVLLDRFAFEGAHRDDSHLRVSFLFELGAEVFEASFAFGSEDTGEVSDITGGMDVFDFFGLRGKGGSEDEKPENTTSREELRRESNGVQSAMRHAQTNIEGEGESVNRGGTVKKEWERKGTAETA
jgi:hypothetical protein